MAKLLYSPFDFPSFRKTAEKNHKITILNHHVRADIIISSYLDVLEKYVKKYSRTKKYLLWTHEPYHDFTLKSPIKVTKTLGIALNGIPIHIMNVYTKDVFTHNFRYFYFKTPLTKMKIEKGDSIRLICDPIESEGKPIVALATYYNKSYYEANPHTLLPIRYKLIEKGVIRDLVDVHGKGWENHKFVSVIGNSRNQGDRRESKSDIMKSYRFNICLENANMPYYVTEKIWEPIKYGCLPIYYANSTIYEVFPKNSFIDVSEFSDLEQLYDYLMKMSVKEYKERYNSCIDAFNSVIYENKNTTWRGKSSNLNINYLEYQSCYDKLVKKIVKIA